MILQIASFNEKSFARNNFIIIIARLNIAQTFVPRNDVVDIISGTLIINSTTLTH